MLENLEPGIYTLIINDSVNCSRTFELELNYQGICEPICGEIEANVFIEGSYNQETDQMYTLLNNLGYLPGQRPITFFGKYTDAGQPYNKEPWYYYGVEGLIYEARLNQIIMKTIQWSLWTGY